MGGVAFTLCISQTQMASPMEAWARVEEHTEAGPWQCHPSLSHHHVHYRPLLHPRIPTFWGLAQTGPGISALLWRGGKKHESETPVCL